VIRLLLVRAGLTPETLQLRLFTRDGVCYARLALAWPSRKLAVEADGREPHDAPDALYRDRSRQNDLVLAGWTVLRFTWSDVRHRPAWVVAQVRRALAAEISTNGS
jgi:very-short-patch-repair endonuclease